MRNTDGAKLSGEHKQAVDPWHGVDFAVLVERCSSGRTTGNRFVQTQQYADGLRAYQEAIDAVASVPWTLAGSAAVPADVIVAVCEQRQLILSNTLVCLAKLGFNERIPEIAQALLDRDAGCARPMPQDLALKVRYRKAMALMDLGRLDDSMAELQTASALAGGANDTIADMILTLADKMEQAGK